MGIEERQGSVSHFDYSKEVEDLTKLKEKLSHARGFQTELHGQIVWTQKPGNWITQFFAGLGRWVVTFRKAFDVINVPKLQQELQQHKTIVENSKDPRLYSLFNETLNIAKSEDILPGAQAERESASKMDTRFDEVFLEKTKTGEIDRWIKAHEGGKKTITFLPGLELSVNEFKEALNRLKDKSGGVLNKPDVDLSDCHWITGEHLKILESYEPARVNVSGCNLSEQDLSYCRATRSSQVVIDNVPLQDGSLSIGKISGESWIENWKSIHSESETIQFYPGLELSFKKFKELLTELSRIRPIDKVDLSNCQWITPQHLKALAAFNPEFVNLENCTRVESFNNFNKQVTSVKLPSGATKDADPKMHSVNEWLTVQELISKQGPVRSIKFPSEWARTYYNFSAHELEKCLTDLERRSSRSMHKIREVDLSNCQWVTPEHLNIFRQKFPSLAYINIEGCTQVKKEDIPIEVQVNAWLNSVLEESLGIIEFSPNRPVSLEEFQRFFHQLQQRDVNNYIKMIDLSGCDWITKEHLAVLSRYCFNLETVILKNIERNDGLLIGLQTSNKGKETLILTGKPFDKVSVDVVTLNVSLNSDQQKFLSDFTSSLAPAPYISTKTHKPLVFTNNLSFSIAEMELLLRELWLKRDQITYVDFSTCSWVKPEHVQLVNNMMEERTVNVLV